MKNIAIILAAGNGTRFGTETPKQFTKLAGKPVILYTIEAFQKSLSIDEIIIVTNEEYIAQIHDIVHLNELDKVRKVICGGKERYNSTWVALQAIEYQDCHVILHDAVRPFISQRIISDCVSALKNWNAVDVVVDPTDTIVQVKDDIIDTIPNRKYLRRGQTPQAFRKSTIENAYHIFMADPLKEVSDDCGIVLKYLPDESIYTIKGEESNFKITYQQDIYLADNIIKDGLNSETSLPPLSNDHFSNKVVIVFGGTSGIGEEIVKQCRKRFAKVYAFSRSTGHDISHPEKIQEALEHVFAHEGRIDFVVNTVGLLIRKPLSFMSVLDIHNSCNVNYLGTINIAKESYSYLKKSHGMLVNFTSSSFTRGRATYSLYSSSKAAVVNFTQALAQEWLSAQVKVNCINPERTDTPMRRANFGSEPEESLLTVQEVADTTLCVMNSGYSGHIFSVRKLAPEKSHNKTLSSGVMQ